MVPPIGTHSGHQARRSPTTESSLGYSGGAVPELGRLHIVRACRTGVPCLSAESQLGQPPTHVETSGEIYSRLVKLSNWTRRRRRLGESARLTRFGGN
jgi:hypothetical protein